MSRRRNAWRALPRRAITALVAAALVISVGGCADIERGVGTTLNELAASRAAATLASDLEGLDGVGFVASDYDAVASRLHVQLVLTGEPDIERANWGAALDAVLAADADPDLSDATVAATVLTEDGGGLALSTGTLGTEATASTVNEWLDILTMAPLDFMVEREGETGIRIEVSSAGLSGNESSTRLDRVALAAGVERRALFVTTTDLARLLTVLRGLDIESASDSWFLPGLIAASGRAAEAEQLDAVQSILTSIGSSSPLAGTSMLGDPEGLFIVTTPLGLMVNWYADQRIDALDLRGMTAWPAFRAIVESIPVRTGASVTLMAPGGGASLFVGTCDGVLTEGSPNERSLVEALQADLALGPDALSPGHCTPEL